MPFVGGGYGRGVLDRLRNLFFWRHRNRLAESRQVVVFLWRRRQVIEDRERPQQQADQQPGDRQTLEQPAAQLILHFWHPLLGRRFRRRRLA